MGDLSANFSRSEFACKCGCGWDTVDTVLLEALQGRRESSGAAMTINSGCRCEIYNEQVGGGQASQHLAGRAADVVEKGITPRETQDYFETLGMSVGRYPSFTHVDSRSGPPARWNGH
jgi:uncharacterized protein YcbK (DUF882 family)